MVKSRLLAEKKKNSAALIPDKNHRVCNNSNETKKLSSLGCLDRVYFLAGDGSSNFHMGGDVTGSILPFQGRIWCCNAIKAGFILSNSLAPLALLNDWQAIALIVAASLGCHEYAVITLSYGCTNHNKKSCCFEFIKQRPRAFLWYPYYLCP